MTHIKKFCSSYDIEKHIVVELFNRLYNILDSKKDRVLFINLIIKSCNMSLLTKEDVLILFNNLNKIASSKYFRYKKLNLIFELCPYFAKILSKALNMTNGEIRRLFDKNKISVNYIINLIVTQSKKHPL